MSYLKNITSNFFSKLINDWLWMYGVLSVIFFSYIGAQESLQRTIHKTIPVALKNHILLLTDLASLQLYIFFVAIVFGVLSSSGCFLKQRRNKKIIENLQQENLNLENYIDNRELDTYSIFSAYLKTIYDDLKMTSEERVSLYKLDLNKFICIGRYSDNEIYREKTNRLYPKDQGCIGKAWEMGDDEVVDSPPFEESEEAWYQYHMNKYHFSRSELVNIKMKSCSFKATRLRNSQEQTIAVIVFESMMKNGVKFGTVTRYFSPHTRKALVGLIESLNAHIPELEMAMEEGF
ncbi:MAG: hypothetical protein RLY43_2396 [Bacteroidota bacterium]|jgi:hypothetical protein